LQTELNDRDNIVHYNFLTSSEAVLFSAVITVIRDTFQYIDLKFMAYGYCGCDEIGVHTGKLTFEPGWLLPRKTVEPGWLLPRPLWERAGERGIPS